MALFLNKRGYVGDDAYRRLRDEAAYAIMQDEENMSFTIAINPDRNAQFCRDFPMAGRNTALEI